MDATPVSVPQLRVTVPAALIQTAAPVATSLPRAQPRAEAAQCRALVLWQPPVPRPVPLSRPPVPADVDDDDDASEGCAARAAVVRPRRQGGLLTDTGSDSGMALDDSDARSDGDPVVDATTTMALD